MKKERTLLIAKELSLHPHYNAGGLTELNLVILLRMLSTIPTSDSQYKSRIVLAVSNAEIFSIDASYRWFLTLMEGLDIELRFVVRPGSAFLTDGMIHVESQRRFQGKEELTVTGPKGESGEEVMKRALEICPDLESLSRPGWCCYYRRSCDSKQIT